MQDKVVLVTGATAGIGRVAACELARRGAKLTFVGRNHERCAATLEYIRQATSSTNVEYIVADLSSYQAVKRCAEQFANKHDRLDVLLNNAGAIFLKKQLSADGIEMTWALNHFGYLWLTQHLLELLTTSAPSRIINVSSSAHKRGVLNNSTIMSSSDAVGYSAYAKSKLANLLFTYELAKRLEDRKVTVNGCHPGVVSTNFGLNNGFLGRLYKCFTDLYSITADEGAKTLIYLACDPSISTVTGKYFVNEKITPSSTAANNADLASRLWQWSEEMTDRVSVAQHQTTSG